MSFVLLGILGFLTLMNIAMAVAGLLVQRRQARFAPAGSLPAEGVSVILPIKGLDPGAREHYRQWLTQEVDCPYEVIFSLQDPADPVLPVLEDLLSECRETPARILINPVLPGLNGKGSNLAHGVEAARYPYLVMADSDILPDRHVVQRLVPPLRDVAVGQVASLPVVKNATNLWGGMMALTWNMGLTANWAPRFLMGMAKNAAGACFAIRRDVLERIGSFQSFGGYVAEDYEMTRRILDQGFRVVLGPTVTLEQGDSTLGALTAYYGRCGYVARHLGAVSERVVVYLGLAAPTLILAGAALTGNALLTWAGLASLVVRSLGVAVVQLASDPRGRWRYAFLFPVVELFLLACFVRPLLTDRVCWRGVWYRVQAGGLLARES